MQEACAAKTPVALYGLTCIPQGMGKCELKSGQSFFWEVAHGTLHKLGRLQTGASEMVAAPASLITQKWQPRQGSQLCILFAGGSLPSCAHQLAVECPPIRSQKGRTRCFRLTTAMLPSRVQGSHSYERIRLPNIRAMDATGSCPTKPTFSTAVMVEAEDQDIEKMPTNALLEPILTRLKN